MTAVVMTYNVKVGVEDWPARRGLLLEIVRRNDPDVLCVQEALTAQLDDLRAGLPGYAVIGEGREGGNAGEWTAILVRSSRFDVAGSGSYWLSDSPDVPGSNTWGSLFVRMATWAQLVDVASGAPLRVVTTHFDHDPSPHGDDVRRRSAELVVNRTPDGPVVFLGDCNEPAGDGSAWTTFAAAGFRDAWELAGADDDVNSFNDWMPPARGGERIDWMLVRGDVAIERVRMDHDDPSTWVASDHFPVVAELAV
jgi:endonuclease/exonuclease/phosphatase family metal-dependent hydrolase